MSSEVGLGWGRGREDCGQEEGVGKGVHSTTGLKMEWEDRWRALVTMWLPCVEIKTN